MSGERSIADHRLIFFGLPKNIELHAAFGRLTIRYGQLEYSLRMMVKSLACVTIEEALDATASLNSKDLRKQIKKLAKKRFEEGHAMVKLNAMLERSKQLADKRNRYIHSLWACELDGSNILRNADHTWEQLPDPRHLDELADDIISLAKEMNSALIQKGGFLFDALNCQNNFKPK